MQSYLHGYEIYMNDCGGAGDCLFNTIAEIINREGITGKSLRSIVA